MSKSKKEKKGENSSMHRFKFICIFGELEIMKNREFLTTTSDLDNVLAARKINCVYGGGI